jgi:sterol desaturase/sphingolipid hydroxylase (fatty acid hydroxylase superfamily)
LCCSFVDDGATLTRSGVVGGDITADVVGTGGGTGGHKRKSEERDA